MIKIIFVCHGNICRSPAAEYIFKYLIKQKHLEDKFECSSYALTDEEIGNDIYPPMKQVLDIHHIPYSKHKATRLLDTDLYDVDYLVYMDNENKYLLDNYYHIDCKTICLAKFINQEEISDPWYHRGFEGCYQEIYKAIDNFITYILKSI